MLEPSVESYLGARTLAADRNRLAVGVARTAYADAIGDP